MTTFESALDEEAKWLANIVNQTIPTDPRSGHRTYIGPTEWFNLTITLIPATETTLLANWNRQQAWKWA